MIALRPSLGLLLVRVNTRRRHKRHNTAIPAVVRQGEHSIAATTRDISLGGLFLFTDAAFRQGTDIEVVLLLPKEIGLPESGMVCCHGKIVRTERASGQFGVAAEIERFQVMPQA